MKYFIQCCAVYFAVMSQTYAADEQVFVDISLHAYHFNRETARRENLNEETAGLGVRSMHESTQYMLGAYRNSKRRSSVYALAEYDVVGSGALDSVRIGGVVGLATGYPIPLVPVIGIRAAIPITKIFGITLTTVPAVKSVGSDSFVAVQFYIRSR